MKNSIRSRFSSKNFICNLKLDSMTISTNIENLLMGKSSLELLLNEIKTSEISILSLSKKSKNENIKNILKELGKELTSILNDKEALKKILEKENQKKKRIIQNKLFDKNEQFINSNNVNKKSIEIQKLNSELFLLKTLNFIGENYLKQIDCIIYHKTDEIDYLKLYMDYKSIQEKEIICEEQKYLPFVAKLLHKELHDSKKKFRLIINAKQIQNEEMENINENLKKLKIFINNKKKGYIEKKEIIQEESKEYSQSIILNKMNSNINMNNLLYIGNQNKIIETETENEYGDNIIIVDTDDEESFNSGRLTGSSNLDKTKKINITNNIQQLINLNMNINFNLNFLGKDNENIICNSERKTDDIINLLNKNKKKKGLSSTGSLPYVPINSIKEESIEMSINENIKNNKKKVNDSNSIIKLQNSKEILNQDYLITE